MAKPEVQAQLEQYRELTPTQVALALAQLARELDHLAQEQGPLERAAVEAREEYSVEYAKIFLGEEGNNEERKQATIGRTHALRIGAELAETEVKLHLQRIATLRKRIDIARSAAALVRAEYDLMNTPNQYRR